MENFSIFFLMSFFLRAKIPLSEDPNCLLLTSHWLELQHIPESKGTDPEWWPWERVILSRESCGRLHFLSITMTSSSNMLFYNVILMSFPLGGGLCLFPLNLGKLVTKVEWNHATFEGRLQRTGIACFHLVFLECLILVPSCHAVRKPEQPLGQQFPAFVWNQQLVLLWGANARWSERKPKQWC